MRRASYYFAGGVIRTEEIERSGRSPALSNGAMRSAGADGELIRRSDAVAAMRKRPGFSEADFS
jgi:hypothetical protein